MEVINMNKEAMIHILNQHGIDVLYEVYQDEIANQYANGYDTGFGDGWNECYDTFMTED